MVKQALLAMLIPHSPENLVRGRKAPSEDLLGFLLFFDILLFLHPAPGIGRQSKQEHG